MSLWNRRYGWMDEGFKPGFAFLCVLHLHLLELRRPGDDNVVCYY